MRHAIRWQSSQALACQPKEFPLSTRLWPASQGRFLHGYPGLFSGFIKIDAKTNKTHGFEHFTCNPLRDPHFQKIYTKINQWDHGPNQSFHQRDEKTCRHAFIQGSFQRSATISCNCSKFWCMRTRKQKS